MDTYLDGTMFNPENMPRVLSDFPLAHLWRDYCGVTPFMTAACLRDTKLAIRNMGLLLAHGAEVDVTDHYGRNALIHAVSNGASAEIIEFLYGIGAPRGHVDKNGQDALIYACKREPCGRDAIKVRDEVLKVILKEEPPKFVKDTTWGLNALMWAVAKSGHGVTNLDAIKLLLDHDPENAQVMATETRSGRNALTMACGEENVEVMKLLLARGVMGQVYPDERSSIISRYGEFWSDDTITTILQAEYACVCVLVICRRLRLGREEDVGDMHKLPRLCLDLIRDKLVDLIRAQPRAK